MPSKRKVAQPVQGGGARFPDVADVLILGAGAAGLMCAREAASKGLSVVLLERGPVPGRKLAVSGGGKANFTNRAVSPKDYRCDGSRGNAFCAPALKGFTPEHMLRIVQEWDLPFEERTHGQLFLTVSAQRLVRALADDCRKHGCVIACGTSVTAVEVLADGFSVQTDSGSWRGKALVLALGSPAWPQAGGGGAGYRLAEELGHSIVAPHAVLAPLRLNPDSPLLAACRRIHREVLGRDPAVMAVHAGLECGLIGEKYPGMDMVSFGPTIQGAHSPDERLDIPATAQFWEYLKALLARL